jgi:hypothetical protein
MNRSKTRDLALVLVVAFLASLAWVLTKGRAIEGDDAIMGLMALHISKGQEFPIFFWQAHYSGPIASYLAAPLHWFFQPSPVVLHSVLVPIHLFYCAGMYFLAKTWLDQRNAMIVGLFAALPSQLFPYSALGGFTESMAFVPWIFLLCLGESNNSKSQRLRFLFGGFLCGFALWVFPLAFPPVLACFICQYKAYGRTALKLGTVGCLLALLPAIYYNLSQPGATILRLLSRPSALDRQAASQIVTSEGITPFISHFLEKWALASYQALLNVPHFTLSLFDLEAGATVWSHISGIIVVFASLLGLWAFFRDLGKTMAFPHAMLGTVMITYCFLIFFGLNRDRYLIPILLIVPFGLALSIQRLSGFLGWRISAMAVAAVLLVNCLANFSNKGAHYRDYQGLAQFLESKGHNSGYAPYKAAYPLVYLSNERLIYTPAFHEPQFDRCSDYTTLASTSKSPAFLFDATEDIASFRGKLEISRIAARETIFRNYTVFYELSPRTDFDKLK